MNHWKYIVILICACFLFFILGNNLLSLTNPDEVFYALSASEMAQHHTWLVPYIFDQPQFEKPILVFWLLRIGSQLFGDTSFGARFFPALFALFGGVGIYLFCRSCFKNEKKAMFCALILISSGFYIAMARVVMTDMIFAVLVAFSLYSFYTGYIDLHQRGRGIIFFFIFSALAVLTKGLLGIVFPLATVLLFLSTRRDLKFLVSGKVLIGVVLFLVIALPWYMFMMQQFGRSFFDEFFVNDHVRRILVAEHASNDKWYFYPLIIILGMLPWTIFVIAAFKDVFKQWKANIKQPLELFLMSWIVCVFVVCQVAHSKLASYILPLFPAVAIITGNYLWEFMRNENKKKLLVMISLSCLPLVCLSIGILLISTGKIVIPFKYYDYIPTKMVADTFFTTSIVFLFMVVVLAVKGMKRQGLLLLSVQIPLLLILVFSLRGTYEPYVSSRSASEYLRQRLDSSGVVLCSKMFVRGVRYYTKNEVAAIGNGYFSPHPIPMLDSEKSISDFMLNNNVLYAVVKKSDFEKIKEAVKARFKVEEMKHIGDAYILKMDQMSGGRS